MMTGWIIVVSIIAFFAVLILIINMTDFWMKPAVSEKRSFCPDIVMTSKGNRTAALMVHEYHGTPESLRYQGEALAKRGMDIYIPAMPGAADSLEDMRKLSPPDFRVWYVFLRDYYINLTAQYESIIIVGASIGGSLALMLAAGVSPQPRAIVTLASPVKITGRHFRKRLLRNTMLRFSGLLALFSKEVPTREMSPEARKLVDFHGVDGVLFPASVHSQKIGLRGVRKALRGVKCPVLAIHADGDATVGSENIDLIARGVSSDIVVKKRLDLSADTLSHRHRLASHTLARGEIRRWIGGFLGLTEGK
jgi:carboxylesterase